MFGNIVLESVNASLARAQFAFLLVLLALGKWECLNVCHFLDAEREREKASVTLFFWAPKSLQMVIAAMKLKDAYSLEGKL